MFVYCTTSVPFGLGEVERRFDSMRTSLGEWADIAYREGEQLRSRVGPTGTLAKSVALDVGLAEIQRRGLVYPVHWSAVGAEAIFPQLRADLVLSQNGLEETTLTLEGTYDPPMGAVGRMLDRAILGRIAEATVRNWLERLAGALTAAD